MSRNSNIIFLVKMSAVNAVNTSFAMNIIAISENQGVKTSIFDKNNFLHFCGRKFARTMFSKKKQQIVLSLDFSVSIICSNTKNS